MGIIKGDTRRLGYSSYTLRTHRVIRRYCGVLSGVYLGFYSWLSAFCFVKLGSSLLLQRDRE